MTVLTRIIMRWRFFSFCFVIGCSLGSSRADSCEELSADTVQCYPFANILYIPNGFSIEEKYTRLFVQHAGIVRINVSSFNHVSHIRLLSIGNNKITIIENNAFSVLTSLKELIVRNNDLDEITQEWGLDTVILSWNDNPIMRITQHVIDKWSFKYMHDPGRQTILCGDNNDQEDSCTCQSDNKYGIDIVGTNYEDGVECLLTPLTTTTTSSTESTTIISTTLTSVTHTITFTNTITSTSSVLTHTLTSTSTTTKTTVLFITTTTTYFRDTAATTMPETSHAKHTDSASVSTSSLTTTTSSTTLSVSVSTHNYITDTATPRTLSLPAPITLGTTLRTNTLGETTSSTSWDASSATNNDQSSTSTISIQSMVSIIVAICILLFLIVGTYQLRRRWKIEEPVILTSSNFTRAVQNPGYNDGGGVGGGSGSSSSKDMEMYTLPRKPEKTERRPPMLPPRRNGNSQSVDLDLQQGFYDNAISTSDVSTSNNDDGYMDVNDDDETVNENGSSEYTYNTQMYDMACNTIPENPASDVNYEVPVSREQSLYM